MFFFDERDTRSFREKSMDPGFDDSHDAASSVFSPEMDSTCSQLHTGSEFLKNIKNSASCIDFSAGRQFVLTVYIIPEPMKSSKKNNGNQ